MRKIERRNHRFFAVLLAVLLIPMLTLTVCASSDKYPYSFTFNMSAGVRTIEGTKTDLDESTANYAGVSILAGNLGVGSVRFWVNDHNGRTITTTSAYTNTLPNNISLTYTDLSTLEGNPTVTMYCQATQNVYGLSGNFQP